MVQIVSRRSLLPLLSFVGLCLAAAQTAHAADRSFSLAGSKLILDEACVRMLRIEPDASLADKVDVLASAERASDLDTLKLEQGTVATIGRDGLCPYDNRIDSTLKLFIKVPPGFSTNMTLNGRVEASYGAVGGVLIGTMNGRIALTAETVKSLDLTVNGTFSGTVDAIDGSATINGAGLTNLQIKTGTIDRLAVNVAGAGKTEILATVRDATLLSAGAGSIRVREVTGKLDQKTAGVGSIKVGF